MVQESGKDTSWTSPWGGGSGMPIQEVTPGPKLLFEFLLLREALKYLGSCDRTCELTANSCVFELQQRPLEDLL